MIAGYTINIKSILIPNSTHSVTAALNMTSTDLPTSTSLSYISEQQLPSIAPIYPSLEHFFETSSPPNPSRPEIQSIASLVPSTVLTLVPDYHLNGSANPEVTTVFEPDATVRQTSSEVQRPSNLTSPLPTDVSEDMTRKPADGGPLEEGSVSLMLPKDAPAEQPGMFRM